MTSRQADARSLATLDAALSTNEGRIALFRQLAAYEEAEDFETWCQRWRHDPKDPAVNAFYSNIHNTYMVAWKELGSDLFWRYMAFGHSGLRRST